jgi:hypothetical protein
MEVVLPPPASPRRHRLPSVPALTRGHDPLPASRLLFLPGAGHTSPQASGHSPHEEAIPPPAPPASPSGGHSNAPHALPPPHGWPTAGRQPRLPSWATGRDRAAYTPRDAKTGSREEADMKETNMPTTRRRVETPYANDDTIMPFGRYRGRELRDVPLAYWRRLLLYRLLAEQYPTLHEYAMRRCPNSRAVRYPWPVRQAIKPPIDDPVRLRPENPPLSSKLGSTGRAWGGRLPGNRSNQHFLTCPGRTVSMRRSK